MDEQQNNEGGGEHWSQGFEHSSVTPDNREAFNTSMAKYESQNDAIVGGYNAQKAIGQPYKFPETMESLPDDASRSDFTSKARSLLGVSIPQSIEDMKDIDFKSGLAEGSEPDGDFVNMVKEFAVAEGIPNSTVEKFIKFNNGPLSQYAIQKMATDDTAKFAADEQACNDALIADPAFGSLDKVKEQSELFKRAISGMSAANGLTVEESGEVVDAMVEAGLTKNPKLAKIMLQAFAPMAGEGGTHSGDGSGGGGKEGQLTPYQWKMQEFPASNTEWGNPNDTWDNESAQLRRRAGIK